MIDRRLPVGDEVFLDHVGHFVADPEAASRALARAGFAPTPISVQVNPDPAGGAPRPTGTGNVTAMLDRGYLEVLFRTPSLTLPSSPSPLVGKGRGGGSRSEARPRLNSPTPTPGPSPQGGGEKEAHRAICDHPARTPERVGSWALVREFEAAMSRYHGVHLVAFAVADAAETHGRLAQSGFRMQPLVSMQRPVRTATGEDVAAFSIARIAPGEMPEGRIQALTHRTEHTVWQPRWLSHKNGARALLEIVIAEADPSEAAARFCRFLGREARIGSFGPAFHLDRGRVQLVAPAALARLFPKLAIPDLPFIAAYAIAVASLDKATACLRAADVNFEQREGSVTARFPHELGTGCWIFVEDAGVLSWRR